MVDRRQLRERAGKVKESVAGTVERAAGAAAERGGQAVRQVRDKAKRRIERRRARKKLENFRDQEITDQREARLDRARVESVREAQRSARQDALADVRNEFAAAREERLEARIKLKAQPKLIEERREADRAQAALAAVEGRREAREEAREERLDDIKEREKKREKRRLSVADEPRGQQPAGGVGNPFGGAMFGAPPQEPEPQRQAEPAPAGGFNPFGDMMLGAPPQEPERAPRDEQPRRREPEGVFGAGLFF
jgi:hypothetical protein